MRFALSILALFGLFAFPWPYAALLAFLCALYVPPVALAFGFLSDALYWAHNVGFPTASLFGIVAFIVAFFANRFIRSRMHELSFD